MAVDFAKTHDKLEIVGGAMGDTVLDVEEIKALAALPSLDELRATIVGLIQAPASKIARTINEPGAQLARVFGAYAARESRLGEPLFINARQQGPTGPPRSIKWLTSPSWSTSFPN